MSVRAERREETQKRPPPMTMLPSRDDARALSAAQMSYDFVTSRNDIRAKMLRTLQEQHVEGGKGADLRLRFVTRVRDTLRDFYPDVPASAMTVTVSTVEDALKVLEIYEAILTRIAAEGLDPIWRRVTGR